MYMFSLRYAGEMEITDPSESTNVISAPLPTRVFVSLYSWYFTGSSLVSANLMRPRKCMFPEKTSHAAAMNAIWQITLIFVSLTP